jgi:hypothetical protein
MLSKSHSKIEGKFETNWYMFVNPLYSKLCADYISLKLLFYLEPITVMQTSLQLQIEILEKILKLYWLAQKQSMTALADAMAHQHNIEELRKECLKYDPFFDEKDIKELTKHLNDKSGIIFQKARYGTEKTNSGLSANTALIMPVIDKVFFKTLMLLPKHVQGTLNYISPIRRLIESDQFDQSQNRELLLSALKNNNPILDEYIASYKKLDQEHEEELQREGL